MIRWVQAIMAFTKFALGLVCFLAIIDAYDPKASRVCSLLLACSFVLSLDGALTLFRMIMEVEHEPKR